MKEEYACWNDDGLPKAVVADSVLPKTEEEYNNLVHTFNGVDREGPGNNKYCGAEDLHAKGLKGEMKAKKSEIFIMAKIMGNILLTIYDAGEDESSKDGGIDEVEVQVDISTSCAPGVAAERARVQLKLEKKSVMASIIPANSRIVDDYDPTWMLKAHPSSFPHDKGARPKKSKLSEEKWAECILRRYPLQQFGQNISMISDMFNIIQRHKVNTSAWVQFRFRPKETAIIANMTGEQMQDVVDIMADTKLYGENLTNRLNAVGE